MAKLTQFIINMTEDDNGHISIDSSFMVDGKEATYSDVSINEKYDIVQALHYSLGTMAYITMGELKAEQEKKEGGKIV